jgi:hypothetical protein
MTSNERRAWLIMLPWRTLRRQAICELRQRACAFTACRTASLGLAQNLNMEQISETKVFASSFGRLRLCSFARERPLRFCSSM